MKKKHLVILIQAAVLVAIAALSVASVAHAKRRSKTGEICVECRKVAEAYYTENCKGDDTGAECQKAKKTIEKNTARKAK